jgi:hypothetical protein
MSAYRGVIKSRTITISNKSVTVDSNLEERIIRQLDSSGYRGLWERPKQGITVWKYNYTPDIELCVAFEGMTHRALVEIKPEKSSFSRDISKRMRKVARYYHTNVLLLYADKEKQWYRIDRKSGKLSEIALLQPGDRPINKLYQPMSLAGRKIYNHRYRKRLNPLMIFLGLVADALDFLLTGHTKKPVKNKNRSRTSQ